MYMTVSPHEHSSTPCQRIKNINVNEHYYQNVSEKNRSYDENQPLSNIYPNISNFLGSPLHQSTSNPIQHLNQQKQSATSGFDLEHYSIMNQKNDPAYYYQSTLSPIATLSNSCSSYSDPYNIDELEKASSPLPDSGGSISGCDLDSSTVIINQDNADTLPTYDNYSYSDGVDSACYRGRPGGVVLRQNRPLPIDIPLPENQGHEVDFSSFLSVTSYTTKYADVCNKVKHSAEDADSYPPSFSQSYPPPDYGLKLMENFRENLTNDSDIEPQPRPRLHTVAAKIDKLNNRRYKNDLIKQKELHKNRYNIQKQFCTHKEETALADCASKGRMGESLISMPPLKDFAFGDEESMRMVSSVRRNIDNAVNLSSTDEANPSSEITAKTYNQPAVHSSDTSLIGGDNSNYGSIRKLSNLLNNKLVVLVNQNNDEKDSSKEAGNLDFCCVDDCRESSSSSEDVSSRSSSCITQITIGQQTEEASGRNDATAAQACPQNETNVTTSDIPPPPLMNLLYFTTKSSNETLNSNNPTSFVKKKSHTKPFYV